MNLLKTRPGKKNILKRLNMGLIALLCALLMVLTALPASAGHASNASAKDSTTTTFGVRTTFVLGGFGPEIAMLNEREGWGGAFGGTAHTSDGGQTWQVVLNSQVVLPGETIGSPPFVFDGQTLWSPVADEQTFGTTALLRTNDGGQTWTRFADPALKLNPENFSVIDQQRSWVYLHDFETQEQALYLVGDANQNWQQATLPTQSRVTAMHFLSQRTGWVVSDRELYMTSDGARTWVKQNLPLPAGIADTFNRQVFPLGFANSSIGFLRVEFVNPDTFAFSSYVYRTLDGGRSWHVYGSAQPENTDHIAQIDVWNLTNPTIPGFRPDRGAQVVLANLRAGKWQIESFATPSQIPGNCSFCFYSRLSSHLIFLSDSASDYPAHFLDLYKSTDGGQTWQQLGTTPGEEQQ